MAHAHESNTKRIWIVFGILSVITIVEVLFGIYKPKSLYFNNSSLLFFVCGNSGNSFKSSN